MYVGSYRHVNILGVVSNFLERAVYPQLESFLASNNSMYANQSDFRKSYSTDNCLIHLLDTFIDKTFTANGLYIYWYDNVKSPKSIRSC